MVDEKKASEIEAITFDFILSQIGFSNLNLTMRLVSDLCFCHRRTNRHVRRRRIAGHFARLAHPRKGVGNQPLPRKLARLVGIRWLLLRLAAFRRNC